MAVLLDVEGIDFYRLTTPDSVEIGPQIIDAPNTGRAANSGEMYRKIVTDKDQIKAAFPCLGQADCQSIVSLAYREFVTVNYMSPGRGQRYGVQFYIKVDPPKLGLPKFLPRTGRKEPWTWDGLQVTLTEK